MSSLPARTGARAPAGLLGHLGLPGLLGRLQRLPAGPAGRLPGGTPAWLPVTAVAVVVVLLRLPLLGQPVSADEGGYLLLAGQWAPGSSLYGEHWVDRPPLLVAFFALADLLGGVLALRVLGVLLAVASVLLAARVGALLRPDASGPAASAPAWCALVAGVFLSTPMFGTWETNGELITTPVVLLGVLAVLRAARAPATRPRHGWLLLAGAAAAVAVLVKQNVWDVVVVVVAAVLVGTGTLGGTRRAATTQVAVAAAGALTLAWVVLGLSWLRGTDPAGLWDAVVSFRFAAGEVIAGSASRYTPDRLRELLLALAVSGAPVLVALLVVRLRRPPVPGGLDLRAVTVAVLAWEAVSVLAGGSYWLHYLICFVPGLVLTVGVLAVSAPHPDRPRGRRWWPPVVAYAAVVALVASGVFLTDLDRLHKEDRIVAWLRQNTSPGDDAVIAWGAPSILQRAGLDSPYPDLWSLTVRVRDPELRTFADLLDGPDRPDWLVLTGDGLDSWGIDASDGEVELMTRYRFVTEVGRYRVYEVLR